MPLETPPARPVFAPLTAPADRGWAEALAALARRDAGVRAASRGRLGRLLGDLFPAYAPARAGADGDLPPEGVAALWLDWREAAREAAALPGEGARCLLRHEIPVGRVLVDPSALGGRRGGILHLRGADGAWIRLDPRGAGSAFVADLGGLRPLVLPLPGGAGILGGALAPEIQDFLRGRAARAERLPARAATGGDRGR